MKNDKTNLEGMLNFCNAISKLGTYDDEAFGDMEIKYDALRKFENGARELKNQGFNVSDFNDSIIAEIGDHMINCINYSEASPYISDEKLNIEEDIIEGALYNHRITEKIIDLLKRNADPTEFNRTKKDFHNYFKEPNMIINNYEINSIIQYFQNELKSNDIGMFYANSFKNGVDLGSAGNDANDRAMSLALNGRSKLKITPQENISNDQNVIGIFDSKRFELSDYLYNGKTKSVDIRVYNLDFDFTGNILQYKLKEGQLPILSGTSDAAIKLDPNEPYKVIDKIIDIYKN